MHSAEFKLKIITPMFMAGEDGRTSELRPSEFKGMMRFWWRAIRADNNIDNLRKNEAEIFGGSGEGEGKSKIKIKIIPKNIFKTQYRPLPHSDKKKFTLPCIKENSTFNIILLGEENFVNIFKNIFTISTILGGFGKRSRRGFGSIEITEPIELNFVNLHKNKVVDKILEILKQINNHYEIKDSKIVNTMPGGNYPWIKEIEMGKEHKLWEELLKKIGNASHNHKNPSLGNAYPRMASPIYISVIKINNSYYPIVTTLNSAFPKNFPDFDLEQQNAFKREVLQ